MTAQLALIDRGRFCPGRDCHIPCGAPASGYACKCKPSCRARTARARRGRLTSCRSSPPGSPGSSTARTRWRHEVRPRDRLGYGEQRPVVSYLGLTTDEVQRMKPSDVAWASIEWPLIHMGMSRHDCELWLERHGYPAAPKSACRMCPMRSDAGWRRMKIERPDDFAAAVEVDRAIRTFSGLKGEAYLHDSLTPLEDVDLSNAEDRGQLQLCETSGCMT